MKKYLKKQIALFTNNLLLININNSNGGKRLPVEIDKNVCGLCLGCAMICPESIYYIEEEHLKIDEGCTDCGICIEACPVKAINQI